MSDERVIGIPATCPRCDVSVEDWSPRRVQTWLAITLLPCRHQFNDVEVIFPQEGKPKS